MEKIIALAHKNKWEVSRTGVKYEFERGDTRLEFNPCFHERATVWRIKNNAHGFNGTLEECYETLTRYLTDN